MEQRFRDRRCPSGSGWGKALAKREAPPAKLVGPWPVKPRLAIVTALGKAEAARPRPSYTEASAQA